MGDLMTFSCVGLSPLLCWFQVLQVSRLMRPAVYCNCQVVPTAMQQWEH